MAHLLAQTVISLAKSLSFDVVAEGIETDAQRNLLQNLGCDLAQGYLYSRPLPAEQLANLWLDGSVANYQLRVAAS